METTYQLDVRGLSHKEKEGKLFPLLETMKNGESLAVTFDFDPLPLLFILSPRPELKIAKEQQGSKKWVVRIDKSGSDPVLVDQDGGLVTKKTLKEEILKSLCDVHLETMRETLVANRIPVPALHPVHTFMEEHKLIVDGLHKLKGIVDRLKNSNGYAEMGDDLETLKAVSHLMVEAELHHQREEEALFPGLHRHGVTEPPVIMKEEHVEFRTHKRALFTLVNRGTETPFEAFKQSVIEHGEFITRELESHIFKEDNILYQIALQVFTEEDWKQVKRDCDKIGYCCFKPQDQPAAVELDLRPLPPVQRHRQIFEKWEGLPPGGVLRITNDHDPKPLHYQFEAELKGQYTWTYEQQGPEDWVVGIGRL